MSTQNTTRSRIIGLSAEAAQAKMSISLIDEDGTLLEKAVVKGDGSCVLSEEALASADGVVVEPAGVLVEADRFRELIETETPVSVKALLASGVKHARPRVHTSGTLDGPGPGGGGGGITHPKGP
jgi:hypothetical protein